VKAGTSEADDRERPPGGALRMSPARVLGLLICLALLPGLRAEAAGPAHIAIIARGYTEPFWQSVREGALRAARDFGVTVSYEAPDSEPLADGQAAMVSAALAENPAALCIDALDSAKIVPLLQKAHGKVPIIGFGYGVDSPLALTTAATDNAAAAALAANKMAALLGDTGTVGVIVRDQASRSGIDRRDGFLKEMKKRYPGIRIAGPGYSGGDPQAAADLASAMIKADADLRGLFCGDEDSAAGILKAVQEQGLTGRVVVVGFDSGQAQVDAIRAGLMAGAVMQDPIRLGYKTVEAAVDVLNGRRVPRRIDTGFHWYDGTNVDDPAIAVLLHP
jgi:ribose transport system substrate-binding protein